jgi:hypothetical protein
MSTVELILLVLFAAGSIIVKIFAALKEQAEKKEAKRRAEQRELDNLRTGGRTTVTEARMPAQQQDAQTARAALEEMAAKRRAQIEELRRRRAASAGGMTPTPPPMQPAPVQRAPVQRPQIQRAPDRPVLRTSPDRQRRTPTTPPRSEAERQQRNRVQQQFEQQREVNEARDSRERQRSREGANRLAEDRTNAAVRAIEASAAAVRGTAETEAQQSRARELSPPRLRMVIDPRDLKRAIILQELLGPPLSLRQ